MDPQEYKIFQTAKTQGKDDAFIKNAILAYRATKPAPVNHLDGFSVIAQQNNPPTQNFESPRVPLTPGNSVMQNIKRIPGELLSAGKPFSIP